MRKALAIVRTKMPRSHDYDIATPDEQKRHMVELAERFKLDIVEWHERSASPGVCIRDSVYSLGENHGISAVILVEGGGWLLDVPVSEHVGAFQFYVDHGITLFLPDGPVDLAAVIEKHRRETVDYLMKAGGDDLDRRMPARK